MTYLLFYLAVGVPIVLWTHFYPVWATRRFRVRASATYELWMIPFCILFWPAVLIGVFRTWPPKYEDLPEPLPDPRRDREMELVRRRQDELARYSKVLPYCSGGIRVVLRDYPDSADSVGVYYCKASDLHAEIGTRVSKYPHLAQDHEGWLLAWLSARNDSDDELVTAPIAYTRLLVSINQLVRDRKGWLECLLCGGTMYDMQRVTYNDDAGALAENYNCIYCPSGHLLLRSLRIRFIGRRVR